MGGNPQASQGSLLACPDVLGEIDAHPRARRQGRRRSTRAAPAPPTRPTSGSRSCPAPTPRSCSRSCNVLFAEGLVDLGDARRPGRRRRRRARRSRAEFTPERVAATCRHPGRDASAASRTSSPAAPTRRALRPHRAVQPGVRHAGVVAGRRGQHPHRQLRPARRADVRQPGRVAARRRCPIPQWADGVDVRPLDAAACAARPRCSARCRLSCLAEEIATPGDGPDPGALHRSPATRCISAPDAGRLDDGAARARVHDQRRQLPQRDDAPRRT